MARQRPAIATRPLSPGAGRPWRASSADKPALQRGPGRLGGIGAARGAEEGPACLGVAEQEKPVMVDYEEDGISRRRYAAGDRGRVVAAEARRVDRGIGQECG